MKEVTLDPKIVAEMEAKMAAGRPLTAKPETTTRATVPVQKSAPMSAKPAPKAVSPRGNVINVKQGGNKDGTIL